MSRHAFGPNLARLRVQRQLTVEQIANTTKVAASLFHGLERNDFSRWPTGLYARAFVRQYAEAIGEDGDSTVDEFCRWFPQGDRRLQAARGAPAESVGREDLEWEGVPPGKQVDRRGGPAPRATVQSPSHPALAAWFLRLRRSLGRA